MEFLQREFHENFAWKYRIDIRNLFIECDVYDTKEIINGGGGKADSAKKRTRLANTDLIDLLAL